MIFCIKIPIGSCYNGNDVFRQDKQDFWNDIFDKMRKKAI